MRLRFSELIDSLKYEATETALSDLDVEYRVLPVDPADLVHIGVILVPVVEGLAALPCTAVLPDQGFEQIDLSAAQLLDAEVASYYLGLMEDLTAHLTEARRLLEEVVASCAARAE